MKRTPQENLARQLDTLPTAQAPLPPSSAHASASPRVRALQAMRVPS